MSKPISNPAITPFLWFDQNAEEAAEFYIAIFPNSRRVSELHNTGDAPGTKGGILTISFELSGVRFVALNGGPQHQFNEAVSFVVNCETQDEIDYYWEKLTADGGSPIACGWLKDKYGLRWQITPTRIGELVRSSKAMQALMQMTKLDIAELERAGRS